MKITPKLKQHLIDAGECVADDTDNVFTMAAGRMIADGRLTADTYKQLTTGQTMTTTSPSPEKLFAGNGGGSHIRVKAPSEMYDETRHSVKHVKTGLPAYDPIYQREVAGMSEGSKARHGVFLKHLARKAGILREPASEHEAALLSEICERQAWCGKIGAEHYDYIGGDRRVKALIDDGTSGGLEITPIEFDADVVSFPLLTGELFPLVDLRPVPRGRRIEGASIQTPTISWGGGDNQSISLFNTNSMVAAIDTTIFAVDGAVQIGRDTLADSPVEVGQTLTQLVGERLGQTLDQVVANGNGTTQPEGLFQASGVGSVTTSGTTSLGNYEELLFTLAKQYRRANNRVCFISNDTTYQRRASIPVGASDARRLFGMTHNDYMTLGWPHKIDNNLANEVCGFAAMMKYRMYRRLGLEIRFEQGGDTLARANLVLMVYRARFGGRLVDGSAFAKWTDGPS